MPIYALEGMSPSIDREVAWIAPCATLVGKVIVQQDVGIWFGVVARGDNETITIGRGSNIQENTILHTDMGFPLTVGEGCTVGHRAVLHGCTIGNNCLIGMGAIILNGAHIGDNCLIAAGTLVPEGKEIPQGSLVVGTPGRIIRSLDEATIAGLGDSAAGYVRNARRFSNGLDIAINITRFDFDPA